MLWKLIHFPSHYFYLVEDQILQLCHPARGSSGSAAPKHNRRIEENPKTMDWWSKFFGGPSHTCSGGQYHGRYGDDTLWNYGPRTHMGTWSDYTNEDIDRAIALSLSDQDPKGKRAIGSNSNLAEDEQLARALQESLNMESPQQRHGTISQPQPHPPHSIFGYRRCAGCHSEIGHGSYLSCMGGVWHPACFRCHSCNQLITDNEFSVSRNHPYHKSCYKAQNYPTCDVCKCYIPRNMAGLVEYRAHPFWMQKYCPSHEHDRTPRCCSCERMEPRDVQYLALGDGRKLCLECLGSSIMDTSECQPLYLEIREFYEGLNMKIDQQIPLLLVERQALNEAMEGEKHGIHHMAETRGLCLSEEQIVRTITRRPGIGAGYSLIGMRTQPYSLIRCCDVTAILILFGLPRLLTGSILAHEMMHAWLRLNGNPNLRPEVEEGICQVLGHMWLESEIMGGSASSSTQSSSGGSSSSKKGRRSLFDKKLGEFFKYQIESDTSSAYGIGFRKGHAAVTKYGLRSTIDHIKMTGSFPI